ncbi:MAG: MiaB/RimO family radical SAM methylthiotransferase [Oligoflexia bacterium]|nr:MiaB/RimO family radical SAM methylthiotransferase [Oligoflexia bacterium]
MAIVQENCKKICFFTLGCRLNTAESDALASKFLKKGFALVSSKNKAERPDVVFINTCSVTADADATSRHIIRKMRREHAQAVIVVSGCFAENRREELASMLMADLCLSIADKEADDLVERVEALLRCRNGGIGGDGGGDSVGVRGVRDGVQHRIRTRAFVKVQDGCDYFCAYCIVPHVRGRARSLPIPTVLADVRQLLCACPDESAPKEIVLTGVNIGSGKNFKQLILEMVKLERELPQLRRWRISSIEPNTVDDELLNILKSSSAFQPYFHIPLQSGSERILQKMGRRYSCVEYRRVVENILTYFPRAGIGADVIVGYLGEGDTDFMECQAFIRELPLTHLHVFPYSPREKTRAFLEWNNQKSLRVDSHDLKQRTKILRELGEVKLATFANKMCGTQAEVLFEGRVAIGESGEKIHKGYTGNYLEVGAVGSKLKNQIMNVKLERVVISGNNGNGGKSYILSKLLN